MFTEDEEPSYLMPYLTLTYPPPPRDTARPSPLVDTYWHNVLEFTGLRSLLNKFLSFINAWSPGIWMKTVLILVNIEMAIAITTEMKTQHLPCL